MLEYLSASSVNVLLLAITVFTFVLKVFAVGDAALRPAAAFPAAGKRTKTLWLGLTAAAFVVALLPLSPIQFLNIAGDVIAIVYLVDVRPALRELGPGGAIRRGKPRGGPGGPTGW